MNPLIRKYVLLAMVWGGMCLFFGQSMAQGVAAYKDLRNYFYVFEKGRTTRVDIQPIPVVTIGSNAVLFENNLGQLRLFRNDDDHLLCETGFKNYVVTDYLIVIETMGGLFVNESGKVERLTPWPRPGYIVQDSLIVFIDNQNYTIAYFEGKFHKVDFEPFQYGRADNNIFTYMNDMEEFKVFYHGKTSVLDNRPPESYYLGKNTIGYIDFYRQFKIFHRGNLIDVDSNPPRTYKVGDDVVAWTNNYDQLMAFQDGLIMEVEPLEPTFYNIKENMLVYGMPGGEFKVYANFTSTTLENYIPREFKLDDNMVAWIDRLGYLKVWDNGKIVKASTRMVQSFEVYNDVVVSYHGRPEPEIYWNGKIY